MKDRRISEIEEIRKIIVIDSNGVEHVRKINDRDTVVILLNTNESNKQTEDVFINGDASKIIYMFNNFFTNLVMINSGIAHFIMESFEDVLFNIKRKFKISKMNVNAVSDDNLYSHSKYFQ